MHAKLWFFPTISDITSLTDLVSFTHRICQTMTILVHCKNCTKHEENCRSAKEKEFKLSSSNMVSKQNVCQVLISGMVWHTFQMCLYIQAFYQFTWRTDFFTWFPTALIILVTKYVHLHWLRQMILKLPGYSSQQHFQAQTLYFHK